MPTKQITDTILMIRPANFGFNAETAASNAFQSEAMNLNPSEINDRAMEQFDTFVGKLREAGVTVIVKQDTNQPKKTRCNISQQLGDIS